MRTKRDEISAVLQEALSKATDAGALPVIPPPPRFTVSPPPQDEWGDFATNLALVLARPANKKPTELAETIVSFLPSTEWLESVQVAPPGFINITVRPQWLAETVHDLLEVREGQPYWNIGEAQKVQVEFVSANPTGPLQIGNARGAAIGDALACLLAAIGYQVDREYYINDVWVSGQIQRFGKSLEARYRQVLGEEASVPEDGYHGEYLVELARMIVNEAGDQYLSVPLEERVRLFNQLAVKKIVEQHREVLLRFGVQFDQWVSEQWLYDTGRVDEVIQRLSSLGLTYAFEDALWLATSRFGDEEDRVLVRQTGAPTYLASDIAYHLYKWERGYQFAVVVWGADHHGHSPRLHAALRALKIEDEEKPWLRVVLYQLVRLVREGEVVRMSKRAGELVALDDLLDWIGKDAARFFLLSRSADAHLDIDLDLAIQKSQDNPVYYVQYGHARCCAIFRQAAERNHPALSSYRTADLSVLNSQPERRLIRQLAFFPDLVKEAALSLSPHLIPQYLIQLADRFHDFYERCRVLSDDPNLSAARLFLVAGAKKVFKDGLSLIGVDTPE
ncbi:MAG: arginine--tRNA ligase, partial [Armatimonadetes bacterium]|nr:arginine--tRNA ligase [Armatimonadota bacterium]